MKKVEAGIMAYSILLPLRRFSNEKDLYEVEPYLLEIVQNRIIELIQKYEGEWE